MTSRNLIAAVAIVAFATLQPGCTCFKKLNCGPKRVAPTVDEVEAGPAFVTVGGQVHQPQRIAIDRFGLTLSGALSLAGGPRVEQIALPVPQTGNGLSSALVAMENAIRDQKAALRVLTVEVSDEKVRVFSEADATRQATQREVLAISGVMPGDDAFRDARRRLEGLETTLSPLVREVLAKTDSLTVVDSVLSASLDGALDSFPPLVAVMRSKAALSTSTSQLARPEKEPLLVSIKRLGESKRTTFYFPLESVQTGIAGSIALQDGDCIGVVPVRESTLVNALQAEGKTFALSGLVTRAGQLTINEFVRLGDIQTLKPQGLNAGETSLVLTRLSRDRMGQDVFVLPSVDNSNVPFGVVATMPADQIQVVPTTTAPLIMHTLVGSIVGQVLSDQQIADRVQTRCAKLRERAPQRLPSQTEYPHCSKLRP